MRRQLRDLLAPFRILKTTGHVRVTFYSYRAKRVTPLAVELGTTTGMRAGEAAYEASRVDAGQSR